MNYYLSLFNIIFVIQEEMHEEDITDIVHFVDREFFGGGTIKY